MSAETQTQPAVWDRFDTEKKVYIWLCAIFLTSLIIANLVGAFLFTLPLPLTLPLLGDRALLSAGIIPFPVTFILTDLLNEYYGAKGARFVTYVGFAMSILVFAFLSVGALLPVAEETVIRQSEFLAFAGNYASMFVASLTAYLIGQLLDIQIFGWFKAVTQSRMLWLRATGSTVLSQVFDSLIVTFIAFSDDLPVRSILQIAASNYAWKFAIAVAITPLLYLGHILLKRLLRHPPPARAE